MSARDTIDAAAGLKPFGALTICRDIAEIQRLESEALVLFKQACELKQRARRLRAQVLAAMTSPFKTGFVELRGR